MVKIGAWSEQITTVKNRKELIIVTSRKYEYILLHYDPVCQMSVVT